jgi:hypothetical protein
LDIYEIRLGVHENVYTRKNMKNEDYLLGLVKGTIHGLETNIMCMTGMQSESADTGFSDGEICGMSYAVKALNNALLMYDEKAKNTLIHALEEEMT